MTKFCPSCGTKLEEEYNFCPSCGFDLRKVAEDTAPVPTETKTEGLIICDNCGEENKSDNKICGYCGAPLKGTAVEKAVKEIKSVKEKPEAPKQKQSKPKTTPVKKTKELDQKKMFMIIGGVLIVIFIILWASGVFNSSVPGEVSGDQVSGQSSGVD